MSLSREVTLNLAGNENSPACVQRIARHGFVADGSDRTEVRPSMSQRSFADAPVAGSSISGASTQILRILRAPQRRGTSQRVCFGCMKCGNSDRKMNPGIDQLLSAGSFSASTCRLALSGML